MAKSHTDELFTQIDAWLTERNNNRRKKSVDYFRWHSMGEIPNYEYLLNMVKLAEKHPKTVFYVYTKRFNFVSALLTDYVILPKNFIINLSEWHGNLNGYTNFTGLNRFIFDDGTDETLKKVAHCPAVDKNGKSTGIKCTQCRRCMQAGKVTAVYAH